jgi:hypothetical protein
MPAAFAAMPASAASSSGEVQTQVFTPIVRRMLPPCRPVMLQ